MQSFFHKQFQEEFLRSEKLRVSILLGFFALGSVYSLINYFFLVPSVSAELASIMRTAMAFLTSMTAFMVCTLFYIQDRIRTGYRPIPGWLQYAHAMIEISSPGLIIAILAGKGNSAAVLHSPLVYLYFPFIILSTLRLNSRITIFISVLAAAEFLSVNLFYSNNSFYAASIEQLPYSQTAAILKSCLILLSGLGAAFVAQQIRREIDGALSVAEKGSRLVNLFGQQVSHEIVDEMIKENGVVPSKLMRVCVMFIDIRNFTTHVTGKSPAEIVEYQNAFFSIVIDSVTRHKGIINQFLGDGCMITFGAPLPLEAACTHAVDSALEIQRHIDDKVQQGTLTPTKIGVGIHVGEVVTGNIGTHIRQQYSITGSPVILAARLEQLNKDFQSQILISSEVREELNPMHTAENLGRVQVKGWDQPVTVFKLA
ncbi:MAG: adenylate/guanylate cyclase domain-containing protein [Cyclobacteriaceae bacterium]|nr:adenylate/guanylate cyclase domain-containing protein [Cyclobacteriaceae bacterium]